MTMTLRRRELKTRLNNLQLSYFYCIPDEIVQEAIAVGADSYQTFITYCEKMVDFAQYWLDQQEYDEKTIEHICNNLRNDEVPSYDVYQFLYRLQQGMIPYANQEYNPFRLDLLAKTNETTDKIVSWSYIPFNWDTLETLLYYTSQRSGYYLNMLPIIMQCMEEGDTATVQLFVDTVKKDIAVAEELYFLSCAVHFVERQNWDSPVPVVFPERKRTLEQCSLKPLQNLQEELQVFVTATEQAGRETISQLIQESIQKSTIKLI